MLRLSKNLRTVTNSDGGVILDLQRGQIFRCNASGAVILDLLTRGLDEAELVSQFTSLCQAPAPRASSDVNDFLSILCRLGLVQPSASNGVSQ